MYGPLQKPPGLKKIKLPYLRLHTTHTLDFGMVKDTACIFYHTKKQMRGLCVGGDMVILFFSDPAVFATAHTLRIECNIANIT